MEIKEFRKWKLQSSENWTSRRPGRLEDLNVRGPGCPELECPKSGCPFPNSREISMTVFVTDVQWRAAVYKAIG